MKRCTEDAEQRSTLCTEIYIERQTRIETLQETERRGPEKRDSKDITNRTLNGGATNVSRSSKHLKDDLAQDTVSGVTNKKTQLKKT